MGPDANFDATKEYADVMLIGESPGEIEDLQGIPFVGRSGQLLRGVVKESGLGFYNIVYTNVVHCHPPGNETPSVKQLKQCYPILEAEIEYYQPLLIILLGNTSLKAVLNESGITNWRGVLIERDNYAIMPTLHPAYILRNQSALDDWTSDFEKAYDYIIEEKSVHNASDGYTMKLVASESDVCAMLDDIYDEGLCSWDTEVNGLRYGDELVCMSFACREAKKAWCVMLDNPYVVEALRTLLCDARIGKIGHNIKFDWLAIYGNWGMEVAGIVGDSMLLSGIIDPVRGRHGLKHLAGRYLGMYDYDAKFVQYRLDHKEADPKRGGDLKLMPLDILAEYAMLDAIATIELAFTLREMLTDEQERLYDELIIPAGDALAIMESNGVLLDDTIVLDYIEMYEAKQAELLVVIKNNSTIVRYTRARAATDKKFVFNPNSSYHMRDVLFGKSYFGLKSVGKTKSGKNTTKWDKLNVYLNDLPFLGDYRYFKLLGKMLSTYLRPPRDSWKDVDGRVRSNYNLIGAETGRLSSSSPNLQNIPTPEKEPGTLLESYPIKNIFTHTWKGGCVLAVDYSGMELRTMASVSGCERMMQAFIEDIDVHSYVTELLFKVARSDYTDAEWKPMRYRAKWVNWTLLFGGSAYTLHNLYGIPMSEANELVSTYYNVFPEVLEYKEQTLTFVRKHSYVENKFGRRRYFHYINDSRNKSRQSHDERAAINFPIQSAASDVLLCSLVILRDQIVLNGYSSLMVNTVHDSIMFDVFPGELDDVAWLCKEVMENLPTVYGPEYFSELDFSWFIAPLRVDIEYGSHYGNMKHYKLDGDD